MIMYKTQVKGIYYNRDNNKLYRVSDGDHKEINILELMNEKNFQLSCELEDADLRNRVIGFIKKLLISMCMLVPVIASGQSMHLEKYCIDTDVLMQECRERCAMWFEVNHKPKYKGSMSVRQKQKYDMIERVAPVAVYMYLRDGGVLPSVKVAMAGLESGWGSTYSAEERNNYFNIKSYRCMHGKKCKHKVPCTNIHDDSVHDMYRGYATLFDSFDEHDRFLQRDRYKEIEFMDDPCDQIREIKRGGYATDANYVTKVKTILPELVSLDKIAHQIDMELRLNIIDLMCED